MNTLENKILNDDIITIKEDSPINKSVVLVGLTKSGKTTLCSYLLENCTLNKSYYDNQDILAKKLKLLKHNGKLRGQSSVLDDNRDERLRRCTLKSKYYYFEKENCNFTITDTPGLIYKVMVRSLYSKSACVYVVSALEKERQIKLIREQILAICAAGIKNLIIAVNKMDMVNFSETVFKNIEKEMTEETLKYIAINTDESSIKVQFIPISCKQDNINIYQNINIISWYKGKSLIEILKDCPYYDYSGNSKANLFAMNDFFWYNDDEVIMKGIVISGSFHRGSKIAPINHKDIEMTPIKNIQKCYKDISVAAHGHIGLRVPIQFRLKKEMLKRGEIFGTRNDNFTSTDTFTAKTLILESKKFKAGAHFIIFRVSSKFDCQVMSIDGEAKEGKEVEICFKTKVPLQIFKNQCPYMNALIIRFDDRTVGLGKMQCVE